MRSIGLMISIPPEKRRYPRSSAFPHPIHGTLEIFRRRTAFGLTHLLERQFGVELGRRTELRQLIRDDAMRAHFCLTMPFPCQDRQPEGAAQHALLLRLCGKPPLRHPRKPSSAPMNVPEYRDSPHGHPAKCSEQLRAVWPFQRCSTDGGRSRIFSTSSRGAAGFVGSLFE